MRALTGFLLLICISSAAMASMPDEKHKIGYLLDKLTTSHVSFVRNGEEHNATWARAHLEKKLKDAKKPDMTADAFITDIASTSSKTGKPYLIKFKDGHTEESGKWFKEQLDTMPVK